MILEYIFMANDTDKKLIREKKIFDCYNAIRESLKLKEPKMLKNLGQGYFYDEVADEMGYSRVHVSRIVRKYIKLTSK